MDDRNRFPLVGKRIREYEILEGLGSGGMGAVYRARHVYLNKERAIKVIHASMGADPAFVDRFIREAQILSELNDPHLVHLYEFGTLEEHTFFMVMELLRGESVLRRLETRGRLPVPEAVRIVKEAAGGLDAAHRQQIVHRDISPDNLLLVKTAEGEVTKVIDFGIAKPLSQTVPSLTAAQTFQGKLEYTSPEQCTGEPITPASDIYSLGVTLYQMVTGKLPFEASSWMAYFHKHTTEPPPPPSSVLAPGALPESLERVILKALSKKREDRQGSMSELIKELDESLAPVTLAGELRLGEPFAGRYQIEAKIGEGGMGTVYRALDRALDVTVVLKVLLPGSAGDTKARDRLKREVKLARRVNHPNVCRIHDFGESEGLQYVSMELVEGESLAEKLSRRGRLSVEEGLPILAQVADGLRQAHRVGIVHRDLTPRNIMVGPDGHATIIDFGLSLAPGAARLTQAGSIAGTPQFMAPEQIRGEAVDRRADLYAMGVILFWTFTGNLPFRGGLRDVMLAHLNQPPPKPSELVPGLDPRLDEIVLRALAKQPERRFQTADELAKALRTVPGWGLPGESVPRMARPDFLPGPEAVTEEIPAPPMPEPEAVGPTAATREMPGAADAARRAAEEAARARAAEEQRREAEERERAEALERERRQREQAEQEERERREAEERRAAEERAAKEAEARALREAEERERAEARRAESAVMQAQELVGRGQHEAAVALLEGYEPAARVADQLSDVRRQWAAVQEEQRRREQEEQERRAAEERERAEAARAQQALTKARQLFGRGKHDAALSLLADYQPAERVADALAELRQQKAALDEQRRREQEERERREAEERERAETQRAQQAAKKARQLFGRGEHDAALALLAAHQPPERVAETLAELRQQKAALDEQRRQEQEERERREAEQRRAAEERARREAEARGRREAEERDRARAERARLEAEESGRRELLAKAASEQRAHRPAAAGEPRPIVTPKRMAIGGLTVAAAIGAAAVIHWLPRPQPAATPMPPRVENTPPIASLSPSQVPPPSPAAGPSEVPPDHTASQLAGLIQSAQSRFQAGDRDGAFRTAGQVLAAAGDRADVRQRVERQMEGWTRTLRLTTQAARDEASRRLGSRAASSPAFASGDRRRIEGEQQQRARRWEEASRSFSASSDLYRQAAAAAGTTAVAAAATSPSPVTAASPEPTLRSNPPPPQPSPNPVATADPRAAEAEAREAITAVLHQYEAAYASRSFAAVRGVWPEAPAALEGQLRSVSSYRLSVNGCSTTVNASTAAASCTVTHRVEPGGLNRQIPTTFSFRRRGDGWVISAVQASR